MVHLMFINSHDQNSIWLKERFRQQEALLHHRKPFGMPEAVRLIHVVVVIFPVPRAGVVRWIDVDDVHLAFVAVKQELESVEVVGIDEHVPWFVWPSVLHSVHRDEGGIDGISKVTHHHQLSYW